MAPFSLAPTSSNTTSIFTTLHPKLDGHFPLFFKDYEPNQDLELSSGSSKLTFQCMPHVSTSDFFRMVFEHLQNCFHVENLAIAFSQLFQFCSHVAHNHIPPQITYVFRMAHFLTMTKPSSGVYPIIMGETMYRLTSYILCL